ncbi:MAG: polymer-forming cytoskeletal protein [Leptospirales bacterium]|nr:polymer-forming cytoskeletal protein [Leptospirales bacterium]
MIETQKRQIRLLKTITLNGGDIVAEDDLLIYGKVNVSRIEASGKTVVIGIGADVSADIRGGTVQVIGTLNGNITASELISVAETATLNGDIAAPHIELAKRCRFSGRLTYI